MKFEKLLKRLGLMCLCLIPIAVCAETSVSVTGFIRQEASTLTGDANVYNQATGNTFNNVPVTNFFGNTITRVGEQSDHSTPLIATRAEIDFKFRFSDSWEGFAKIRGFYEHRLDDEFEDNEYFISGFDDDNGSILETNGEDYMIDIPALYLDYNNGPFWLRMGNQQIAWGDAIFFRIFDVVATGLRMPGSLKALSSNSDRLFLHPWIPLTTLLHRSLSCSRKKAGTA